MNGLTDPNIRPMDLRERRMQTLKVLIEPECGNCLFWRNSGCPKSKLCTTRFVRSYPSAKSEICNRYRPNYKTQELDEEYVYLKLHENL
jgi:hypothetical protein